LGDGWWLRHGGTIAVRQEGAFQVWLDVVRLVAGLIVLSLAADRLVRSAVTISRAFGLSAIIIGAVVIGFGTSVPEFVVSGLAAVEGELDLAVSNVVSSNIANVTLVLGAAAIISTLVSRRQVIRREGLLMFGAVLILAAVLVDGKLGFLEGVVLLLLLAGAILLMMRWSTDDPAHVARVLDGVGAAPDPGDEEAVVSARWRSQVGREIVIGILALLATVIAASFLLDGVIGLGEHFGLSVAALGLVTGVGTSLPELAAAAAAARRKQPELALGNVLGSNIFNSLGVIGLAAVLGPGSLEGITRPFLAAMVGVALVAGLFAVTGRRIARIEGVVLLSLFVGYSVLVFG
jgi:cation:H+ antiporter